MEALFFSFVFMILVIARKDKEKKSHLPRTRFCKKKLQV